VCFLPSASTVQQRLVRLYDVRFSYCDEAQPPGQFVQKDAGSLFTPGRKGYSLLPLYAFDLRLLRLDDKMTCMCCGQSCDVQLPPSFRCPPFPQRMNPSRL
jgi:hypothetical protein